MIQTTFQRYEKKYLLTPAQYQWIFQQLQSRMQVDEYGMYTICSIYFDTDDYRLIRASLEKPVYKEKPDQEFMDNFSRTSVRLGA